MTALPDSGWRNCGHPTVGKYSVIASTKSVIAYVFDDEAAPVIAASPELLKAAQAAELIFAHQKWAEDSTDPEAVALRLLRAAIAKATNSEARP